MTSFAEGTGFANPRLTGAVLNDFKGFGLGEYSPGLNAEETS